MNGKVSYCWKEILLLALVIGLIVYVGATSVTDKITALETSILDKADERNTILTEISGKLDKVNVVVEIEQP